jgi:hypothetical protein
MREPASTSWDHGTRLRAARELLAAFPSARLGVRGGCMEPSVPDGRTVVLADARTHPPRFGDVVLARQGEGLVLHRLVWAPWGARAWRTQADRAPSFDGRLRREDVLGTVLAVEGRRESPRRRWRACVSLLRALLRVSWLRLSIYRNSVLIVRPWRGGSSGISPSRA